MFELLKQKVTPFEQDLATHYDTIRSTPGRIQEMWSLMHALNHTGTGFLHHDRMATQVNPQMEKMDNNKDFFKTE
eukprot:CAMPEP_0184296300 /NCGR_PEP_ID=MMETSP1049-20130417/7278_1 /TAXON_ID=77928 /ORGANISM="Proteomonas sulcata, Strain CCMP704" /LENGTH=74 /DNA_ID=CAMNT_0026605453 /DNA_START=513 /DNA_END=737 /DNA_ORIENTATION=-